MDKFCYIILWRFCQSWFPISCPEFFWSPTEKEILLLVAAPHFLEKGHRSNSSGPEKRSGHDLINESAMRRGSDISTTLLVATLVNSNYLALLWDELGWVGGGQIMKKGLGLSN